MESETKPNKPHHENGQKEPLDPGKIVPTKVALSGNLEGEDYGLEVSITFELTGGR
jgi:hypothetical protein